MISQAGLLSPAWGQAALFAKECKSIHIECEIVRWQRIASICSRIRMGLAIGFGRGMADAGGANVGVLRNFRRLTEGGTQ